ncbi:C10 family peptidase [Sphingobacterium zeae]|uniref:C10 family peptidase n=1 Tax=Sphingobacterium zeae TaxID=1776859 RepID=UPI0036182766
MERTKSKPTKRVRIVYMQFILLLTIAAISCSRDHDVIDETESQNQFVGEISLSDDEITGLKYAEPKEISEGQAIQIVNDFQLKFQKDPLTKSFNNTAYSIIKKTFIDKEGTPLKNKTLTKGNFEDQMPVYEILISTNGTKSIAYVAADERISDIIAIVPTKNGISLNDVSIDPMLQLSQQTHAKNVSKLNNTVDSINAITLKKLKDKFGTLPRSNVYQSLKRNIKTTSNKSVETKSMVQGTINNLLSQVGPLMYTFWHQDYPFNDQMAPSTDCGKYSAGCMVVAISQVMAYHRPNFSIKVNNATTPLNWSLITNNYNGTDAYGEDYQFSLSAKPHVTGLIKAIYDQTGTSPSCSGSSTNASTGINFMKQYFTFNNSSNHTPGINMSDIKSSLDMNRLVFATGKRIPTGESQKVGHAWVVDGYAVTELNPGESIVGNNVWQRYNMYLHANLGWGRPIIGWFTNLHGTGWYLVGKDNNGSLSFQANQEQDYNIDLTFYSNIVKK